MKRLLVWLNRMPCGCTRTADDRYVDRECRRHRVLEWLVRHWILCIETQSAFYHEGRIEWRPWRWNVRAYVRAHPEMLTCPWEASQ